MAVWLILGSALALACACVERLGLEEDERGVIPALVFGVEAGSLSPSKTFKVEFKCCGFKC